MTDVKWVQDRLRKDPTWFGLTSRPRLAVKIRGYDRQQVDTSLINGGQLLCIPYIFPPEMILAGEAQGVLDTVAQLKRMLELPPSGPGSRGLDRRQIFDVFPVLP